MRSARQIGMTVPQFHRAQARDRVRIAGELERARTSFVGTDWSRWVIAYGRQEHFHGSKRLDGSPAACPVRGCSVVEGRPAEACV